MARGAGEHGMNRRHAMAHIAHVRAAAGTGLQLLQGQELAPQPLRVALEAGGERPIGFEVQVVHIRPLEFHPASGRLCAGLETRLHAGLEAGEVRLVLGAHVELANGAFRHDVGRLAALGDDAVDAFRVLDVLAQVGNALVGEQQPVEGVQAPVRHGGGVGCFAVIGGPHLGDADAGHGRQVDAGGMHHQRRIHTVERAGARHHFLAAALLLRRCAEKRDGAGQLILHVVQGERRAQGGGGDEVVATGVADAGQGVVLGQHGDVAATGAETRLKGRRQTVGAALGGQAKALGGVREQGAGAGFVEGELRVGVDVVGDSQQRVGVFVHEVCESVMHGRRAYQMGWGCGRGSGPGCGGKCGRPQTMREPVLPQYSSFSNRLYSLPVGRRGSWSRKSTLCGHL